MQHKTCFPINEMSVVLTGATGGIGQAIAYRLAREGADLLLTGRDEHKLEVLAARLKMRFPNVKVLFVACDLTADQGIAQLVNSIQQANFAVNVLINNAGISSFGPFAQQDEETLRNQLDTNLIQPIELTRQLMPLLKLQPDSMVVNVGSTYGSIGYPGYSLYCASKFGLRGFSEALARESADSGLKVLYVAPRATRTDINSPNVNAMNRALGSKTDDPDFVASEIIGAMVRQTSVTFIGWPEKLFVRINGVLPELVTRVIVKQLAKIKRFWIPIQEAKS
jgi:short-subunit dehydrogenase